MKKKKNQKTKPNEEPEEKVKGNEGQKGPVHTQHPLASTSTHDISAEQTFCSRSEIAVREDVSPTVPVSSDINSPEFTGDSHTPAHDSNTNECLPV
jgi:hypothetical protein